MWELGDKRTLDITSATGVISRGADKLNPYVSRYARHPKDGFAVLLLLHLGVLLPAAFFYELHRACTVGFSIPRALVFNLLRIGPQYANFMWVYVMCHKEAHSSGSLFSKNLPLTGIFNHWVGIFHGVVPGVFTVSHVHNHHRFDNDEKDVYSTAFRPRDEVGSWIK